jgi:hypothetical protein
MSLAAPAGSLTTGGFRYWPLAGLTLSAVIAWITPFDLAFGWATFGSPPLRAMAIILLALAGAAIGRRIGLSIEGPPDSRPARDALVVAVVVAVWCALCDWIWRPALHAGYVSMFTTTPLALRIALFAMRSLNESILYRLFLGSLLIWTLGAVWKGPDGRPAPGAFWTGLVLSQATNIWINVTALAPLTPMALLHDLFRYVAPGVVWGRLYWKRGFLANEIAATGAHLIFQPLVVLGL